MNNAEQAKKENGIKILGSGCVKCVALEKTTQSAVAVSISLFGLSSPAN